MKRKPLIGLLLASSLSLSALAGDLAVSVSIGQPGFYGQLDIGGYPRPALIYSQPMLVEPMGLVGPPIYLRVPPGHAKHWNRHCYDYGACGRRVYFVRDDWYTRVYAPRYREYHGDGDWRGDGEWRGERGREYGHDRDHDRGRGHGHGHGHGRDR